MASLGFQPTYEELKPYSVYAFFWDCHVFSLPMRKRKFPKLCIVYITVYKPFTKAFMIFNQAVHSVGHKRAVAGKTNSSG